MARRAVGVAMVLAAALGLACAGEPAAVPGRLDAVTLHHGQAAVTRVVPVPAGAGAMEIVVTELPEQVVPDSLHADSTEAVQIRAVGYRERTVREEPRPIGDVEALDRQIAALEKSLRENQQAQDLSRKKLALLDKVGEAGTATAKQEAAQGVVPTDELSKLTLFVFGQQDALAGKLQELSEQERQLTGELDAVRRKRAASFTEGRTYLAREALVFLDKQKPDAAEIRLGYNVRQVDWEPACNLRAQTGGGEVELEYDALIQQDSGEPWPDVALTLSTATPTLSSVPPALAPFQVTLEPGGEAQSGHDILKVEREREAAEQEFRAAESEEDRHQAETAANTAAARLSVLYFQGGPRLDELAPLGSRARAELSVSYPLAGRHTLASRRDRQSLRIASMKLKADFFRQAEPALTRYVYRQARMANTSDLVLLASRANAYLDGKFVGAFTLATVRPGQSFTAGFGADTRLLTRKTLIDRQHAVLGGNQEVVLTDEVLVENFGDQPLALRVLDRIPVQAEGKVYVSLLDSAPALSQDADHLRLQRPHNLLRWDVEVPAGATGEKALAIQYRFKIGFDKNLQINAGRAITPFFAYVRPLEPWKVETAWSKDETRLATEGDLLGGAETLSLVLTKGSEGKNVVGRRVEGDLSGFRWVILDLENQIKSGARVALGLSTGKGWTYFESSPSYLRPGPNPSVVFDLTAPSYKSAQASWEYSTRPTSLDDLHAVYILLYPSTSGTVVVHDLKLAK